MSWFIGLLFSKQCELGLGNNNAVKNTISVTWKLRLCEIRCCPYGHKTDKPWHIIQIWFFLSLKVYASLVTSYLVTFPLSRLGLKCNSLYLLHWGWVRRLVFTMSFAILVEKCPSIELFVLHTWLGMKEAGEGYSKAKVNTNKQKNKTLVLVTDWEWLN